MQLRRIGTHRGIEYIVRLTEHGLRYALIGAHGLTAVVVENGSEMPSEEDVRKRIEEYLDNCALEWK